MQATCLSCAHDICSNVEGVCSVQVALLQESAEVVFDEDVTTAQALVTAVEDCGFDAKLISLQSSTQSKPPEVMQ